MQTAPAALSAILYASNGDYADAALAGLGVLPVAGVAAKLGLGALAFHGGFSDGKLLVIAGSVRGVRDGAEAALTAAKVAELEVGSGRAYSVAYQMKG